MKKEKIIEYKKKAKELLSQMTLEEKIGQMCNASQAIERLGIQSYNWWNEALHGVARAGVATVFPQAIGLASTFNVSLMRDIGDCISTEGRAKHNAFKKAGDFGIYKGLTFWSPNINIFRDPRWGRGHETFGEDCCLTSEMAIAYIKGIQGEDDSYLKAAACIKHFVAHSGPEQGRHGFNSEVSIQDFYEIYFPAFERCIRLSKVEGVMGAYNSVNGEICCASPKLIENIVRGRCGFDGYYVSDCGALYDIYAAFKKVSTAPEAAALAVKAGCNLNCGGVYGTLSVAFHENLVTEEEIDKCVLPLLVTKYKLGLIDGENCVFNGIEYSENDCEKHHELSLKASRESIVLLKNDGVLPLDLQKIKKIAVIGPNANEKSVLLGNYNGTPSESYTVLEGIRKVFDGDIKIMYAEGCHVTQDRVEGCAEPNDRMSEAVLAAQNCDVAVVCVGLNPRLEGEEGDAYNSDLGGDKSDLNLPGLQNELIEKIVATGTRTIVVNLSGSAVDLSIANRANAVLQAWYPGMYGGIAIAEILAGKCNPSAKLPVTFYRDCTALPAFEDYSMNHRTYQFFTGEVVYPFGYGLSYAKFSYSDLKVEKFRNGKALLTVSVCNIGERDGREVVQAYVKICLPGERVPQFRLIAFQSVEIAAGERKTFSIELEEYWIEAVNRNGERVMPESATLFVGGSQPDEKSARLTGSRCLEKPLELPC